MFFSRKKEDGDGTPESSIIPGSREYEIKSLRYGKAPEKKKADLFIRAFMMINVAFKNNLHGTSLNDEKKELEKNFMQMASII